MAHGVRDHVQLADPAADKPVEVTANQQIGGKVVWGPDGESLLVVREDKTAQLLGHDGKPGAKLAGAVNPAASTRGTRWVCGTGG